MTLACSRALAAVISVAALPGCADSQQQAAAVATQVDRLVAELRQQMPANPSSVVVRLAFGEEADLDLYVTDPLLETVYFARHESRTGGRFATDVRCDTSGPRIEEVRFAAPWPGRYRVGIDHPERCDGMPAPAPAAYAVVVHADGKTSQTSGSIELERFEVVVLEFEVAGETLDAQTEVAAGTAQSGAMLYQQLCASCHGAEGRGDGDVEHELLLGPRDFRLNAFKFDTDADWQRGTDADLANVIRHGTGAYGGSPQMPPWQNLSEEDIAALVAHVRRLQDY